MTTSDESSGYSRREWQFLLGFTAAVALTWYLTEPAASRLGSALAAGGVSFVTMAVVLRLSSERARQTLLDIVSFLLP